MVQAFFYIVVNNYRHPKKQSQKYVVTIKSQFKGGFSVC